MISLRRLTFSALLAFGLIATAAAQTPIQPTIAYLPNAATPTVAGLLAAPSGTPPNISATVATTSSTSIIGVTVVASDALGLAHIVTSGPAACVFDSTPVAGHFVGISATVAGDCHDAGATLPGSGQIVGVYTGAQGSGNTYIVAVGTTGAIGGSSSITIGSTSTSLMAMLSWGTTVSADSCTSNTVNLPGARPSTDVLNIGPPSSLPANLIVYGAISAADTAQITLCNPTASSIIVSTSNWIVRTASS